MSRLTPTAGLLAAALFLAAGTWWLGNVSLLARAGFAGLPILSAQAAFTLVLGEWLLIGLFACRLGSASSAGLAVSGLSFVVPLWPLLALFWLSSAMSAVTLLVTQVVALALVVAAVSVGGVVERLRIDAEWRSLLRSLVGIALAAGIWTTRDPLQAWLSA